MQKQHVNYLIKQLNINFYKTPNLSSDRIIKTSFYNPNDYLKSKCLINTFLQNYFLKLLYFQIKIKFLKVFFNFLKSHYFLNLFFNKTNQLLFKNYKSNFINFFPFYKRFTINFDKLFFSFFKKKFYKRKKLISNFFKKRLKVRRKIFFKCFKFFERLLKEKSFGSQKYLKFKILKLYNNKNYKFLFRKSKLKMNIFSCDFFKKKYVVKKFKKKYFYKKNNFFLVRLKRTKLKTPGPIYKKHTKKTLHLKKSSTFPKFHLFSYHFWYWNQKLLEKYNKEESAKKKLHKFFFFNYNYVRIKSFWTKKKLKIFFSKRGFNWRVSRSLVFFRNNFTWFWCRRRNRLDFYKNTSYFLKKNRIQSYCKFFTFAKISIFKKKIKKSFIFKKYLLLFLKIIFKKGPHYFLFPYGYKNIFFKKKTHMKFLLFVKNFQTSIRRRLVKNFILYYLSKYFNLNIKKAKLILYNFSLNFLNLFRKYSSYRYLLNNYLINNDNFYFLKNKNFNNKHSLIRYFRVYSILKLKNKNL